MIKEEKPTEKRRTGRPKQNSVNENEDDEVDQQLIEAQIILRHVPTGNFFTTFLTTLILFFVMFCFYFVAFIFLEIFTNSNKEIEEYLSSQSEFFCLIATYFCSLLT